jgi:hypothetical protein
MPERFRWRRLLSFWIAAVVADSNRRLTTPRKNEN